MDNTPSAAASSPLRGSQQSSGEARSVASISETAAAQDLWVPAAIMAIVAFVGGFAFYVGTAL